MAQQQPPDLIYRLLSVLLFFFWLAHAIWHGLKYRQFNYVWQRLGISALSRQADIWVHSSSVGEVELVRPLFEVLSKKHAILLTTFTASGYQHARRIMPDGINIQVLPIDFYPISRAFAHRHNFKLALIAETELWPETLYHISSSGTPLVQINARLSSRSLQTSNLIRKILQQTLAYFDRHLTRTDKDVEQFKIMGVAEQRISVLGNLKYVHAGEEMDYENLIGRPYVLFASTHNPEEKLFAELINSHHLNELVVIAPRHPQRASEILKSLQPLDLSIQLRSQNGSINESTQLYLADTLGELKALMAHARLVVMGGSFVDIGGHNVLEPARLGKAIITGPSDANIHQDIDLLQQHQAIIQVADVDELTQQLIHLRYHPEVMAELADNAKKLMQQQDHVLVNYVEAIEHYLQE